MSAIVSVQNLRKAYAGGFEALKSVNLDIEEGEILALLGPNGAGKTTLISTICGITVPTSGTITVGGHDTQKAFRAARALIGLVPQEINLEPFETVMNTVRFSRGLFGKPRNDAYIEKILKQLSLYDKKDNKVMTLSGGMKRRVLIAKALSHEPRVLFLDEPTAGVDVELRKDMWEVVADLKASGVTIILTTHYIEEAEAIADRVGVINKGEILLIQDKADLMAQMGRKQLKIELTAPVDQVPAALAGYQLTRAEDGLSLTLSLRHQGRAHGHHHPFGRSAKGRIADERPANTAKQPRRHLRGPRKGNRMSLNAIWTIYVFEMRRFFRTITQSFISPVLSTSLYFVVFGAAIGSRIDEVEGVSYGAFIVPGLIMLSVMTQATTNASFGIYFPKFIGTIYELLSAPVSFLEIVAGYVGAAATKALFIGVDDPRDGVFLRRYPDRAPVSRCWPSWC